MIAVVAALFTSAAQTPAPGLSTSSGTFSRQGVVKLEWTVMKTQNGELFELQQATDASFETAQSVYQGKDGGTFISGLENGIYYYRVRAGNGLWSAPLSIEVQHHSLTLAIFLMVVGAAVFLMTLLMILRASKKHQST